MCVLVLSGEPVRHSTVLVCSQTDAAATAALRAAMHARPCIWQSKPSFHAAPQPPAPHLRTALSLSVVSGSSSASATLSATSCEVFLPTRSTTSRRPMMARATVARVSSSSWMRGLAPPAPRLNATCTADRQRRVRRCWGAWWQAPQRRSCHHVSLAAADSRWCQTKCKPS